MSEREQIVARLSDLQAKQEAATEWGAAVGAREEEIRSLESRLLRIDAMTAPPSTETPRHTADDPRCDCGHLFEICNSPNCPNGDEYAIIANGYSQHNAEIVRLTSSHAALTARVAELEAALRPFAGDKLPSARRTEITFDRHGLRRCISPLELARDRAFAALDNADGGRDRG